MRKERPWRNLALVVTAALLIGFIASQTVRPHEGHPDVRGVTFATEVERFRLDPLVVDPDTDTGTLLIVATRPNVTMVHIEGNGNIEEVRGDGELHGVLTLLTPGTEERGDVQRLFSCTSPTVPVTAPPCDTSRHGFAGQFLERRHLDTRPDKAEYETDSDEDALRQAAAEHTSQEHVGEWTFRFGVERDGATRYDAMTIRLVVTLTTFQGKVTSYRGP